MRFKIARFRFKLRSPVRIGSNLSFKINGVGESNLMRWLILSTFLLCVVPVFAQVPTIGVIDVQKVVRESEIGKKALAEVKSLTDKKQLEINQKQSSIQAMQDKLDKQKDILSADAQEKLRSDINKGMTELRRFREDSEQEIQNKLSVALKGLEEKVVPIIQKMGSEKGYSIIITKDALIYSSPKNDVTDEVIRLFNESAGSSKPAQTQENKQ
jgi:outer membrane protein